MQTTLEFRDPIANRLGFWSAAGIAGLFLIFTVCFVAIYTQGPSAPWTNIQDFAANAGQVNPVFKFLAQFSMLLFGPLYVVAVNCIHARAPQSKKLITQLAADFALVFAALSCLHYFVQITTVPWNLAKGQLAGLEHFVQANPSSFILSADMLGWTLFFGLSSLLAAFAFDNQGLERGLRIALLVNGRSCLAGFVGFLLQSVLLVFVTMNFLMGGAVLVFSVLLGVWWRK